MRLRVLLTMFAACYNQTNAEPVGPSTQPHRRRPIGPCRGAWDSDTLVSRSRTDSPADFGYPSDIV